MRSVMMNTGNSVLYSELRKVFKCKLMCLENAYFKHVTKQKWFAWRWYPLDIHHPTDYDNIEFSWWQKDILFFFSPVIKLWHLEKRKTNAVTIFRLLSTIIDGWNSESKEEATCTFLFKKNICLFICLFLWTYLGTTGNGYLERKAQQCVPFQSGSFLGRISILKECVCRCECPICVCICFFSTLFIWNEDNIEFDIIKTNQERIPTFSV